VSRTGIKESDARVRAIARRCAAARSSSRLRPSWPPNRVVAPTRLDSTRLDDSGGVRPTARANDDSTFSYPWQNSPRPAIVVLITFSYASPTNGASPNSSATWAVLVFGFFGRSTLPGHRGGRSNL
jgi:hypothetical protein